MRFVRLCSLAVLALLMTLPLRAQLTNARITHHPENDLGNELGARSATPHWVGYEVPAVAAAGRICCCDRTTTSGEQGCDGCSLRREGGMDVWHEEHAAGSASGTVDLLFHLGSDGVDDLRVFSSDCPVDGGGEEVHWLESVDPGVSARTLERLAGDAEKTELAKRAVMAISIHRTPVADEVLASLLPLDSGARKSVAFWLGRNRGEKGLQILTDRIRGDASAAERGEIVVGFALSDTPGAVERLLDVAKNDASPHVRSKAYFWLAQKAGKKVAGAISDAIENDPDTGVKKQAVFALGQLPPEEGVPRLIEVARNNRNPAVRKRAMFWLGQSNDPRALAFIEEVLER
ncbi:MAG: HEAT repeat domain-containing protein [Thermoanaerobaculia bacterium]